MTRNAPLLRSVLAVFIAALAFIPIAAAGKGGGGGGGGRTTCTQNAPSVSVENNWAWGQTGSWGLPGQQLAYQIRVVNNDVYCSSASFVVSSTAPAGFSVSMPTTTISLKSTTQGYLWAYVTSQSCRRELSARVDRSTSRKHRLGVFDHLLQGLLVRHRGAYAVLPEPR